MNQIIIDFKSSRNDYLEDDFIKSESNFNSYQLVKHWPDFWGSQILIINGPEGSGKSHLASIWKKKSDAFVVTPENITETLFELEDGVINFLIEDVDRLTQEYSEEIFHLYNKVKFSGGYLLLTSELPVFKFKTSLADLKSRLNSALISVIKEPDEYLLKAIFVKQFSDRQISVQPEVIDFLIPRIERSFAGVKKAVEDIERKAAEYKRNITIPFIKEVFGV